jgi:glucosamine kinase
VIGLGLDAGGSATRWALGDGSGSVLASGELPAVNGHLFDRANLARFEAFAVALRDVLAGQRVDTVVAGITGLTGDSPAAATAGDILATTLGVARGRVLVEDDLWIGYHAVFRPGEGHVVYAGTGSVGMHLFADGRILRVGGRGIMVDDAGSAFWIGRRALDTVFRRIDEDAAPGVLGEALFGAIGSSDWNSVRAHVYGGGRNAVAMLALAVAAAARDGDDAALGILHQAGGELARLGLALVHRAGPLSVALLGRAAGLHDAISVGFRAAAPGIEMRLVEIDAAAAAAMVASGLA